MGNRLEYFPDTDTLYVEIRPGRTVGGRDAGENLVIHYGEEGQPVGCEIERASQHPEHIAAAMKMLCQAVRRHLEEEQGCSQS